MKVFLIVLVLVILFVVGSAMMMQYFTGRSAAPKQNPNKSQEESENNKQ